MIITRAPRPVSEPRTDVVYMPPPSTVVHFDQARESGASATPRSRLCSIIRRTERDHVDTSAASCEAMTIFHSGCRLSSHSGV